jgi:hypothetical protein
MNIEQALQYCDQAWNPNGFALEGLSDFIRVPNLTPEYDDGFFTNGLIEQAVNVTKQ